ncbi:Extradiol ring-cleavage dioxygenase class III enzyme subunit B [Leucosporidium creatinivorum]|uniref:Extradiol ring-cleavage dioxygenase class III enzyme subunit B n=1 Tax=Leucosporidium creatinivorum TaxID=106004 RepID=A0A1Y2FYL3_9BASI|nr:Extradiol ring-cleavage dioxygenase class III enzyme subunit B [Leucosporidium creatinivorum]
MLKRLTSYFTPASATLAASSYSTTTNHSTSTMPSAAPPQSHEINSLPAEWKAELDNLPTLEQTGGKIPSIFLAHGQPLLIYPPSLSVASSGMAAVADIQGPKGSLANFLKDLGPALLKKYEPKAIVVFSAHWETNNGALVTDYGEENPLLMDYFGFPPQLYEVAFKSSGDSALSERVVGLLKKSGIAARTTTKLEKRGEDGRGFRGPGFDHGVFVPFKLMFKDVSPIPIIQVSIDASLDPRKEYALGAALEELRSEGVLIISGGLTIHTFRDFGAFSPKTAGPVYKEFERSIIDAVEIEDPAKRQQALYALTSHPGFRPSHPREEHFVPLYIAAGAADKTGGRARVLQGCHGAKSIVFGV